MKNRNRIFVICCILVITTACSSTSYLLHYELRVTKTANFEPMTAFDLVSESTASGTRLKFTNRHDEGGFAIFSDEFLLFGGESRWALVVQTTGQDAQVFILPIPRNPLLLSRMDKLADDLIIQSQLMLFGRSTRNHTKDHSRSKNLSSDNFELRFKLTEWKRP